MKDAIKDIARWLYWFPFRHVNQLLPFRSVFALGRALGLALYSVSSVKRKALEREYGKIGIGNSREAVKNAFKIFYQNELEVFLFPLLNKQNIDSVVNYEGLQHLDAALSAKKGVMLVFAHFGANQMVMPAIGHKGYTMSQLSAPPTVWEKKMPNKNFTPMARKALEMRWNLEKTLPVNHINIFGSLKEAFRCLKKNEILGVAIDGGGGKDRVEVDFLGKRALFSKGAMDFAMRTGCTVLPTFMVRDKNGCHRMIIEPPLEIHTQKQNHDAFQKNITAFVKRLEEYIFKHPCHYLNFLALRTFMETQEDTPFFIKGTKNESIAH